MKNGVVHIRSNTQLVISEDVQGALSCVLQSMREELDDHRLAINEGTQEMVSQNELLNELNSKLDKLWERVDELTLLIKGEKEEVEFKIEQLSEREKEVFKALYEVTQTRPCASYEQIARKCLQSKELVQSYVTSMVEKGVPILKKYDGTKVFVNLDAKFRSVQAKKNIVGLTAALSCWM